MDKIVISYGHYGELITKLISSIKSSANTFCAVHGLMKGGLPIAVAISNALNIPLTVNLADLGAICNNKLILVVDDIITEDSGFARFTELAELKNIKYKTATLVCKLNSFVPDYYQLIVDKSEWVEFPWGHSTSK